MTRTADAYDRVTARLASETGYQAQQRGNWRCPAHSDNQASLSVRSGDVRVTLHCFAGCEEERILDALRLTKADLFDQPPAKNGNDSRRVVALSDYVDESGTLLFQKVRYEPKGFSLRRPNGRGGWESNLEGTRRVLYRLPDVLAAIGDGRRIFVAEGEKDVEALVRAGEVATCNFEGASKSADRSKWRPEYTEMLSGADEVVVIADRDEAGRAHAWAIARALTGEVGNVVVKEAKFGKDAADHLAAGHSPEEFEVVDQAELATAAPRAEPASANGSSPPPVALLDLNLPDDFWNARPLLAHIRQAARARLISPDALLGAVLCRIAALSSHTIELPAIVGSAVGLTYFANLVGGPEAGKSAAASVAADLVPAPDAVLDRLPIGSGEGLVECLFETVKEAGENGKPEKVRRQTRHAAIFHVDEGEVLVDLGTRSGNTLFSTMRAAWSHSMLGATNASAERNRRVPGTAYVFGITVGVQPEIAGPLLAQAPAGTPQRFAWFLATEPGAEHTEEDVHWPGPLEWTALDIDAMPYETGPRGLRHPLIVADAIRKAIRTRRRAIQNAEITVEQLDAHRDLLRLKTAALLALLDHRYHITDNDWELAGTIDATSRRVRRSVEAALSTVEQGKELAVADRMARRDTHIEENKEKRALTSAATSVANKVRQHALDETHADEGGGCTRRCMTLATASKHRALVSIDVVVERAERDGTIVKGDDGRWRPVSGGQQ